MYLTVLTTSELGSCLSEAALLFSCCVCTFSFSQHCKIQSWAPLPETSVTIENSSMFVTYVKCDHKKWISVTCSETTGCWCGNWLQDEVLPITSCSAVFVNWKALASQLLNKIIKFHGRRSCLGVIFHHHPICYFSSQRGFQKCWQRTAWLQSSFPGKAINENFFL